MLISCCRLFWHTVVNFLSVEQAADKSPNQDDALWHSIGSKARCLFVTQSEVYLDIWRASVEVVFRRG
jgi:hypothetical protein